MSLYGLLHELRGQPLTAEHIARLEKVADTDEDDTLDESVAAACVAISERPSLTEAEADELRYVLACAKRRLEEEKEDADRDSERNERVAAALGDNEQVIVNNLNAAREAMSRPAEDTDHLILVRLRTSPTSSTSEASRTRKSSPAWSPGTRASARWLKFRKGKA